LKGGRDQRSHGRAILFYGADVGDADLGREGRAALRNLLS